MPRNGNAPPVISAVLDANMLISAILVAQGISRQILQAAFEQRFAADLDACHQVTLDQWRRRGWSQRVSEGVARLFEDQV